MFFFRKKEPPKVSVGVICYNRKDYICECLDSILPQNIEKEIIVIDDCSTDGTYEILKDYEKNHKEIKVYRNEENKGTVYTRIQSLYRSNGEFLLMVDADDRLIENALPKLYEEAKGFDVLEFSVLSDDEKKMENMHFTGAVIDHDFPKRFKEIRISNTLCNKLISRNVYKQICQNVDEDVKQPNFSDVIFFIFNLLHVAETWKQTPTEGYFYYSKRGMVSHLSDIDTLIQFCGFAVTKSEIERIYGPSEYLDEKRNIVCNQAVEAYVRLSEEDQDIHRYALYRLMTEDDINYLAEFYRKEMNGAEETQSD